MTPAALARLKSGARAILGHDLPAPAIDQFAKYLELLSKWQRRYRLVGSIEPLWVVENLFLDSLLFLRVLPPDSREIVDIGSGAGFPGYPLKIAHPAMRLTLIESRQTRVSFLRAVSRELGLEDVVVLEQRAEVAGERFRQRFDAAVMRCVAKPGEMLPLADRLVKDGGLIIASGSPDYGAAPGARRVDVEGISSAAVRTFVVKRSGKEP